MSSMALVLVALAFAASQGAVGFPGPERRIPMETGTLPWRAASSSWVKLRKPPQEKILDVIVAVRVDEQYRLNLERIFWELSDPTHANYGKHISLKEVTELLAVPVDRAHRVRDYFMLKGAHEAIISPNRDMIKVSMPVSAVEVALDTTIYMFGHPDHKSEIMRASHGYSLPASIAHDVVLVGDLLLFPSPNAKKLTGSVAVGGSWPNACDGPATYACSGLVTPAVLAERYGIPNSTVSTSTGGNSGNSMGVAEFQGQSYISSDLEKFSSACHRNVEVDVQIGKNLNLAGAEAQLDIEYIKAVADNVPLTVISQREYSLLDFTNTLSALEHPPLVVSISFGNDESQQATAEYMHTVNTAFMKAGARGISIFVSSGDQGVCGRKGCGLFKLRFKPEFPASSPYITSVGGTNFVTGNIGEEMAWDHSGGGFSDTFSVPDYQKDAVTAYLGNADANIPPAAYFNNTGRAYPDIAALGGDKAPYCIVTDGGFNGISGTSASCPVAAGIFARLNGLRLAAGKAAMGFLNPFIYQNPSGFHDVTSGINNAGRKYGFTAIKGWDAATGFGTPDYPALAKLVMASARLSEAEVLV